MGQKKHTAGLHRGYADGVGVDWNNRKGGFSFIALLNARNRPVAILLGDYVPGEIDADMSAAADLFCAADDLLEAAIWAEAALAPFSKDPAEKSGISRLRAAIAKARATSSAEM